MTLHALLIQALLLLLLDGNLGGLKLSEILDANICPADVWFSFSYKLANTLSKNVPPKYKCMALSFFYLIDVSNFQKTLLNSLRIYCCSWQSFVVDCFEAYLSSLADWRCCWCAFLISLWSGWSWSKVNFILLKSNQC